MGDELAGTEKPEARDELEREGVQQALVPVFPDSDSREMWRVVHNRVVAVRAEPSGLSTLLGTRRPGARIIGSRREGEWLLLHPDEGCGPQAWMLVDGAELGLGMLMLPDAGAALRHALEAGPTAGPSSAEVVVNVRQVGSGFGVDVRVPREAKVFEAKRALAEFVGRPELLEAKLLRRKSDVVGFAARTDNPGYTSLSDGDDLGILRQLFVVKADLLPAPGSPAELAARELLPKWMFLTEYRPLSLLDERAEPPEPAAEPPDLAPARSSAASAPSAPAAPAARPGTQPSVRPAMGPRVRVQAPPHLRLAH